MLLASGSALHALHLTLPGAFIFFLVAAIFMTAALYQQYERSPDKKNFFNPKKHPLIATSLGLLLTSVIVVSAAFPKKSFEDPLSCALYSETHHAPVTAAKCYKDLAQSDLHNIDYHYGYISNHFKTPAKRKDRKGHEVPRVDAPVRGFYEGLLSSLDSDVVDIAHFGLGLYAYSKGLPKEALLELNKVTGELKYVNYYKGLISRHYSDQLAEKHFLAETRLLNGYEEAYTELVELYLRQHRNDDLIALSRDSDAMSSLEPYVQRLLYFKANNPGGYLKGLVREFQYRSSPVVILAVLLVTLVWLVVMLKLDVFEKERWGWIAALMLTEACLVLAVFPLSDLYRFRVEHLFTGTAAEGFAKYVIEVGLIEESIKILPVILMLAFTRQINEPFDMLLFASLSGLSFAAIENIIYFSEYGAGIIHGRALTVVVGHMMFTSVCAYVILYFKYKLKIKWYWGLIPGLLLAASLHGLWNLLAGVYVLLLVYFTLLLRAWARLIANALNNSGFFSYERKLKSLQLQQGLVFGLTAVLVFEYIYTGVEYDRAFANESLVASLITGSSLVMFLAIRLGNMDLTKGYWGAIDLSPGVLQHIPSPHNFVGAEVELQPYERNPNLDRLLAGFPQGTIINRVMVGTADPDWYLIRLFEPLALKDCVRDHLLIKLLAKNPRLGTDFNMVVHVLVMNREEDLAKDKIPIEDVVEFGWAFLSLREPGKAIQSDEIQPEQGAG
jgi:RsiW-degrading membrane proteinase PrsW (M82 family)